MFVVILLRDLARDFGVEFERLRHREIFEVSARGQKTIGSQLKEARKGFSLHARAQSTPRCTRQLNESK